MIRRPWKFHAWFRENVRKQLEGENKSTILQIHGAHVCMIHMKHKKKKDRGSPKEVECKKVEVNKIKISIEEIKISRCNHVPSSFFISSRYILLVTLFDSFFISRAISSWHNLMDSNQSHVLLTYKSYWVSLWYRKISSIKVHLQFSCFKCT